MIRVNATGCSLVDNLYSQMSFDSNIYGRYLSKRNGDGGLVTGGLTFSEALADFAGKTYPEVLAELTGNTKPDKSNIGGPGIVPMIHAEQVRRRENIHYRFAGVYGRDKNGERIIDLLRNSGFPLDDYTLSDLPTPCTDVLSDAAFSQGRGERTFLNTVGAAADYGPESLPKDFFDADMILFGATALVPPLHDALDELCRKAKASDAFVAVTTVFDFRNEAMHPEKQWPLVEDYSNIDLLVLDREEALKISGAGDVQSAVTWFVSGGCGGVLVTQGADDVLLGIRDCGPFERLTRTRMPTCRFADAIVASMHEPRDTTGCGDNFVGGIIDSLAHQMSESNANGSSRKLNLEEAVISATASGSFALTCLGGVFYEEFPGQKREAVDRFVQAYRQELEAYE